MNALAKPIALLGLLLTLAPPLLLCFGAIGLPLLKTLLIAGMILWYLGAPFWLGTAEDRKA